MLEGSPEPFATAGSEKRAALAHFQPRGVLISHGPERADRRRFNEEVLDTGQTLHRLTDRFVSVVHEEAKLLLGAVRHRGVLIWDDFAITWFRIVRRVVFGDAARDDRELTALIDQLRSAANWAFLMPKQRQLRNQFYDRLRGYLARADPNSLAGMATFRALALLASHPQHAEQAREEINRSGTVQPDLPYLRACVLESLRLWPTTPAVLRQSTVETVWETGIMPAKTGILIFTPFFHRDDQRLPYANRLAPDLWLRHRTTQDWPLIPFSEGPAMCPGWNLVLLVSSVMLAVLLDGRQIRLQPPTRLDARRPLPGTLDNYSLRFELNG